MTSTLQRLEGKGLVAIEADAADGRGRLVAITEAGRTVHADCIVRLQPRLAEMVAAVGADALAGLVEPLTDCGRLWTRCATE